MCPQKRKKICRRKCGGKNSRASKGKGMQGSCQFGKGESRNLRYLFTSYVEKGRSSQGLLLTRYLKKENKKRKGEFWQKKMQI